MAKEESKKKRTEKMEDTVRIAGLGQIAKNVGKTAGKSIKPKASKTS